MPGITKLDASMWRDVIRYSFEGMCLMEIADCVEVEYKTLCRWMKKHPSLKEQCAAARLAGGKKVVEYGLFKLARGSEEVEETASWIETRPDGTSKTIKRVVKKTRPDLKALQTLSKKYAPEFSESIQEGEDGKLNININQLSLREVMELRDSSFSTPHRSISESGESESPSITPPSTEI